MKQIIKRPIVRVLSLFGKPMGKYFDREFEKDGINKILVFCDAGIGDILRVFPVIKILTARFPGAIIYILTNAAGAALFELYPSPHQFNIILFDIKRQHKSFSAKFRLLRSLKNNIRADFVYNSHRGQGMIEHAFMSYLTGAPFRTGYTQDGTGFLYTNKIEFDKYKPIAEQNILLLSAIGIKASHDHNINIRIPSKDLTFSKDLLKKHKACGQAIIAIHPGVEWESKLRSWPMENYVNLIKEIRKNFNVKILILGSKTDKEIIGPIFRETGDGSYLINTLGETSIAQMAGLLTNCHMFIGNDSGPLHIALSLNIPSIAIFGATSEQQVIGTDRKNCVTISKDLPCRPCYLHQPFFVPRCKNIKCLYSISVPEVMDVAAKMIPVIMKAETSIVQKEKAISALTKF